MGEKSVVVNPGGGVTEDAVQVRLVCGCAVFWGGADAPVCGTHQERRIARVVAPPPRFTAKDCKVNSGLEIRHG
jgi:hypothetical protein